MEEKLYEVNDIYLNAYLLSDNIKTEKVDIVKSDGRNKVTFYYADNKELRASVKDYRENDFLKKYIDNYLFTKREITRVLRGAKSE